MPSSRLILGIVPWYSVLIVCGICVALFLCTHEEKRLGLKEDTTVDLALYVIPSGIVGAMLYYVAFSWPMFRDDPLSILKIWNGGLAIYGAILGGPDWRFACLREAAHQPACTVRHGRSRACTGGIPLGNFSIWRLTVCGHGAVAAVLPFSVRIVEDGAEVWHMATFFMNPAGIWAYLPCCADAQAKQRSGDLSSCTCFSTARAAR